MGDSNRDWILTDWKAAAKGIQSSGTQKVGIQRIMGDQLLLVSTEGKVLLT